MTVSLILTLLIVVALILAARLIIGFVSADKVATGLLIDSENYRTLGDCPLESNCKCSTASKRRQHVEPIKYSIAEDKLIESIAEMISEMPGAEIVTQDSHYLHVTFQTRIMAYIDDTELLLEAVAKTLHVRSASRLGKSDYGANGARIEKLRKMIAELS